MATSGSTDFSATRDNIIDQALWELGVLGEAETPSSNTYTKCAFALNAMVKQWQSKGINLWTTQEAALFLTDNDGEYTFNASSGDHAAFTTVETTLSAAGAAAATTLTVTSSTGMTAADKILIELTDNTLHSTTIVSVVSATSITITSGLASAAASGNAVFTYTTKMGRPLKILSARFRNSDLDDLPMEPLARQDYFNIPNKTLEGTPNSFYYDPQLATGKIYIHPRPDAVSGHIRFTCLRLIEDFDAASNNPDFPIEWVDALVFNLAMRLAPAYAKDDKVIKLIAPLAQSTLLELMNWDAEDNSFHILPDTSN